MTTSEKIEYLYQKINWGASYLDAESIKIMNTLRAEVEEKDRLLKWSMNTCNEIQKIKTYGTRFPETAILADEIDRHLMP